MEITGKLVDIYTNSIYSATIIFEEGKISEIVKCDKEGDNFILPGFIDSHIHIESAMVTPGSFAGAAVSRGTIATVSDPHEIANVLGVEGVKFMYSDSLRTLGRRPARGAPAARAGNAGADFRQVRPGAVNPPRLAAVGHRRRTGQAAGSGATLPLRTGVGGNRALAGQEHCRGVQRFRARSGCERLDRAGPPGG